MENNYSKKVRKNQEQKQKRKHFLKLFFIFLTVFVFSFLFFTKIGLKHGGQVIKNIGNSITHKTTFPHMEKINILIMGVDADAEDTHRSDTLMIVALNLKKKKVNVLSIPRDSRVEIAGHGLDKINHSYAFGGVPLVIDSVQNFLNIKINYYVKVDFNQFKKAVETLGGVDLVVEKRMKYTDRAGKLYIDLYPGYQHLNAEQAMGYVRFRHDKIGDIGRIQRQQNFIVAMAKKMLLPQNFAKIPAILKQLYYSLETNLDIAQLYELKDIYHNVNPDTMNMGMIPGYDTMISHISYFIPYQDQSLELANRLINNVGELISYIKFAVLNGSGKKGIGKKATDILTKEGFEVLQADNTTKVYDNSILICLNKDTDTRNELLEKNYVPSLGYKFLNDFLKDNPQENNIFKQIGIIEEAEKNSSPKNTTEIIKKKPDFILLIGKDWITEGTFDLWESKN